MRAIAVIDGEHYPPVVREALGALPYDVVAAWLAGGGEKLRGGQDYGVPLVDDLEHAIAERAPTVVYDLSDEPVLGPRERLALASRVLAAGVAYEGPDFRLEPPAFAPLDLPAVAITGTGKRVGKTAVTGHVARLYARDRRVVVVAMGRGGPAEPELVIEPPELDDLLRRSREGAHAASDYLETAALARVPTVGCRRCGGGLAGATAVNNVLEGVEVARTAGPELLLFDGSGAALPPVDVSARVLVVPVQQPPEVATGYLNAYRILLADLVLLTMCEDGTPVDALRAAVCGVKDVPVVATVQRPRPAASIDGARVAFFTTAPSYVHAALGGHLERAHGAAEVCVSGNLSDRASLQRDLERVDADVFLVELKAAAIDVVAEAAVELGVDVVLADADVMPLPGEPDLDAALMALVPSRATVESG